MKISIWRQFSSNHSGSYTVLGEFKDEQSASYAVATLSSIINAIAGWSRDDNNLKDLDRDSITEVEKRFAEEYRIEWNKSVDWLIPYRGPYRWSHYETPTDHVWQYGRLLIVDIPNTQQTWQGGQQFASFVEAVNGQAYRDVNLPTQYLSKPLRLTFTLRCLAPSLDKARKIHDTINFYLKAQNQKKRPAWWRYHPMIKKYPDRFAERIFTRCRNEIESSIARA